MISTLNHPVPDGGGGTYLGQGFQALTTVHHPKGRSLAFTDLARALKGVSIVGTSRTCLGCVARWSGVRSRSAFNQATKNRDATMTAEQVRGWELGRGLKSLMAAGTVVVWGYAAAQQCDPLPVPYQEDFSGLVGGALRECMVQQNLTGGGSDPVGNWRTASPSALHYTVPVAQVVTTDPQDYDAWLFLPALQLTGGMSYRLSYKYGTNSGSSGVDNQGSMSVWYGSDQDWLTMQHLIVDHGTFSGPVFTQVIDFTPASSGAYHLGFQVYSEPSTRMVVLDDISVTVAPSCLEPVILSAVATTPYAAELEWQCTGCSGEYVVEYGPASVFTTPGTGDEAGQFGTIASLNATSPLQLTDLTSGEEYRVFVRQRCGSEHGASSAAAMFSTALLNGFCGFPAFLECGDARGSATWQAPSSEDLSLYCGEFQPYGTRGAWYRVIGNGGVQRVSTCAQDGGSQLQPVRLVIFEGVCGALTCLGIAEPGEVCDGSRFEWETAPGVDYLVYVTDLSFSGASFELSLTCDPVPTCPAPNGLAVAGLTSSEASITWASVPVANSYDYEVRSDGSAPGSGASGLVASGNVAGGPVLLSGLASETHYYYHVRSRCQGGSETGPWRTSEFVTSCLPTDVPYDGGFTEPAIPSCMSVVDLNGGATWVAVPKPSFQYVGPYVARYGGTPPQPAADDWLFTRGINTTAGAQYRLSYRISVISSVYPEQLSVHFGPEPIPSAMTTLLADHAPFTANNNAPQYHSYLFTPGDGPVYIGFRAYSTAQGWNLFLGDIQVDIEPVCFPPDEAGVEVTGTTSATASWNTAEDAVGYEYEVRTSGEAGSGAAGLVLQGSVAGVSAALEGLAPGTTYMLYVRTNCGASGYSTWSEGVSFNSRCLPTNVPYAEDFSGVSGGALPVCLVRENLVGTLADASGNWRTASPSGVNFTVPVAQVVTVDDRPYDAWLYLQGLELSAGVSYRLSYRYGTNSGSMGANNRGSMAVWLGDGPERPAMQQLIIDHGTFSGPAFDQFVDFTPATDGVHYIGFNVYSEPGTWMVLLDDIVVDVSPSCLEPILLSAEATGATEAEVTWECSGCTGQFIVEYGPASVFTTPGSDDQPGAFGTIASSNATSPFTLAGLVSGERYRVFVRQWCGGGDFGDPYLPMVFDMPLSNGFCATSTWMECGKVYPGATANAPVQSVNSSFCGFNPIGTQGVWYSVIGSGDTFRASTCTEDGGSAIAPTRMLVLGGQQCAGFSCVAYVQSGGECDGARVEWESVQGTIYYVYVMGAANETTSFQLAFSCGEQPACPPPSGLQVVQRTTTGATFTWASTPSTTYAYEVRSSGLPGSGPLGLEDSGSGLASGPVGITGLQEGTSYMLHLRAICVGNESSEWVSVPFRTLCLPAEVPYDGGFTESAIPDCFSVIDVNGGATWTAVPRPIPTFSNSHVASYGPDVAGNDWLITQGISTLPGVSYRLSYRYSVLSAVYPERMGVFYGDRPEVAAMLPLTDHPNITNSVSALLSEVVFTPGEGPIYIGFHAYSLGDGWQLYLGDIELVEESGCGAPSTSVLELDATTLRVDWVCEGCTGNYYVEYGASGFAPGSDALVGEGTLLGPLQGDHVLLDLPTTEGVDVYVRRECEKGQFSVNAGPVSPIPAVVVDCAELSHVEYCYGNNEDTFLRYKSDDGRAVVLSFTQGQMQACCDKVTIYDGPGTSNQVLYDGNGGGSLAGVAVESTNPWDILTLRISSDAGNSCSDNSQLQPLRWTLGCGHVGMEEVHAGDLALYPNPANGLLYLRMQGMARGMGTLQVLDLSGRVLMDRALFLNGDDTVTMDVSLFVSGNYLLRVVRPEGVLVRQFQVVH